MPSTRATRNGRYGTGIAAAVVAVGLALGGCAPGHPAAASRRSSASIPPSTAAPTTTTTTVAPTTTTTTEQPGWTPVSTVGGVIAVDTRTETESTGHQVTLYRFRAGPVHFGLHVGSLDPPSGGIAVTPDDGPAIGPGETLRLLAAFNGGFKMDAGAGGFELDGQVLAPLRPGYASLVIDTDGRAHVGVWGSGVPVTGEQVSSVRQNLPPLVTGGQPSPDIGDIGVWGATLGGGDVVARSSLAEDGAGDVVYAASMDALPVDLADALVGAGAVTAMELDINPEWVQLAWAATPGGTLAPGVPGQSRPADQYQVGWTRDFVTVLSSG